MVYNTIDKVATLHGPAILIYKKGAVQYYLLQFLVYYYMGLRHLDSNNKIKTDSKDYI